MKWRNLSLFRQINKYGIGQESYSLFMLQNIESLPAPTTYFYAIFSVAALVKNNPSEFLLILLLWRFHVSAIQLAHYVHICLLSCIYLESGLMDMDVGTRDRPKLEQKSTLTILRIFQQFMVCNFNKLKIKHFIGN
jgi:hypothetical protein